MENAEIRASLVALLAEGVDRNFWMGVKPSSRLVVLLAEGVDRNEKYNMELYNGKVSPSSRRAWIERYLSGYVPACWYGRPPHGGRG